MLVQGLVKARSGRGRQLGFPTANLDITGELEWGVYAGYATVEGQRYLAAIFVGPVEQFNIHHPQLEAHLLDFSGDLYGKELTVDLQKHLRDYQKFTSEASLVEAIKQDIEQVRQCLPV